jgi:hypothetical protein
MMPPSHKLVLRTLMRVRESVAALNEANRWRTTKSSVGPMMKMTNGLR